MHYYKRNIGDYAAKAGHLSPLEHGIYTLLLDAYYNREEAPTRADAIRWARARTQDEVAAVDAVLSEFFTESEGRYRQQRVEDELRAYHGKAQVNRETAIKREQAKRERTEHERSTKRAQGVHESCSKREPNHKPVTINQEEELKSTVQPAAARSRFDAFWAAYPVKKGKQQARKAWNRIKLDARCDELIAHVRTMQANDDGWRRGYIPMGSTYLNQARWEDEPKLPYATASPQPSHTRTAAETLLNGTSHAQRTLDQRRDPPRLGQAAEPALARLPAG